MSIKKPAPRTLSAQQVADYLRNHLDFFNADNPDINKLIQDIRIPYNEDKNTISLLAYQNRLWRKKAMDAEEEYRMLASSLDYNRKLITLIHKVILCVIKAEDLQGLCAELNKIFIKEFKVSAYKLIVFSRLPKSDFYVSKNKELIPKEVNRILSRKKLTSGALSPLVKEYLFGKSKEVGESFLCAPLHSERSFFAILCLSSKDKNRFNQDLLTDYIDFLIEIIRTKLLSYIKPPRIKVVLSKTQKSMHGAKIKKPLARTDNNKDPA